MMWHGPGFSMMLVVSSRRTPIRHTPYLRRHGRMTRSDRGRGQGWAYRPLALNIDGIDTKASIGIGSILSLQELSALLDFPRVAL